MRASNGCKPAKLKPRSTTFVNHCLASLSYCCDAAVADFADAPAAVTAAVGAVVS